MSQHTRYFRFAFSPMRPVTLLWPMLPLLILIAIAFVFAGKDGASLLDAFRTAWQETREEQPLMLLLTAIALPAGAAFFFLAWQQARRASLVIDQSGIRCHPPGKGINMLWQDPRHRGWRASWSEIQRAVLVPPALGKPTAQNLALWRLELHTDSATRELSPYLWLEQGEQDHRISVLRAMRQPDPETVRGWVDKAPLIRRLGEHGIVVTEAEREAANPLQSLPGGKFDLSAHKGMLAQLGLFFTAAGYALVDGLLLRPWEALEPLPAGPFVATAIAGICLIGVLGRAAPATERVAVGVLCTAALTTAVYPGLLRYNAASAPAPVVHEYSMTQPGIFSPGNGDLPRLDLRHLELDAYWKALKPPAHEFRLYRGEVDIWQLDRGALFERTREFYASRQ